ncbi:putative DNA polymerase III gamma subunit [Nocardia nova SH22a]|uniref:DNA polymerase III subunit gamma/tau n=1 Tax=Nocardia nova SH22a TaxID=1415166 RepID=W5T6Z3_9NOCA|nr:putative DNA polymerase III gamma subunit [Nocardia nova SH22a]
MALYRKYRPATFAEVVGQEHVTDPLSTALDTGRISHAYLFSGPRGCGKTSSARILARSLNCVEGPTSRPCGVCSSCVALAPGGAGNLDVIELDAASHGGVDDTRELRDRAFYAPAESRYRVFIVDEAHMVTTAGFNALLKIVEEPPAHLIFIFATTEPEKVLPTIRSRTHHYPFRLLPPATMRGLLGKICDQEQVQVEESVYPLVIRAGGGSPRDSLSVLDQLLAGAGPEGVTYPRALALLGVTDIALIDEAIEALATDDGAALFATVDRVVEAGHDPRRFATDLLERIRDLILLRAVPDAAQRNLVTGPGDVIDRMAAQADSIGPATLARYAELLHEGLGDMRGATAPRLLLEVICARMLLPSVSEAESAALQRLERLERRVESGVPTAPAGPSTASAASAGAPAAASAPPARSGAPAGESRRRGAEALAAMREKKSAPHPAQRAQSPAGPPETSAPARSAADAPADRAAGPGSIDHAANNTAAEQNSSAVPGSVVEPPADAGTTTSAEPSRSQVGAPSAGTDRSGGTASADVAPAADGAEQGAADRDTTAPAGGASGATAHAADEARPSDDQDVPDSRTATGGSSSAAAAHPADDAQPGAPDSAASVAADNAASVSATAPAQGPTGATAPTADDAGLIGADPDAVVSGADGDRTTSAADPRDRAAPADSRESAHAGAADGPDAVERSDGGSEHPAADAGLSGTGTAGDAPACGSGAAATPPSSAGDPLSDGTTGPAPGGVADTEHSADTAQPVESGPAQEEAAASDPAQSPATEDATPASEQISAGASGADILREIEAAWADIRAKARESSAALNALLSGSAGAVRVEDDTIVFAHPHAPLAQRLSTPQNVDAVRAAVHAVIGRQYGVRWEVGSGAPADAGGAGKASGRPQARGGAEQSGGRGVRGDSSGQSQPPRFVRPSQNQAQSPDGDTRGGQTDTRGAAVDRRDNPAQGQRREFRPPRSAAGADRSAPDDDIPPPDAPDYPDDPGPSDYSPVGYDGVPPALTPEEEQEMLAESARPVPPEQRRDPDEVALELLRTELGATRMGG